MQVIPVTTPLLRAGDDLAKAILQHGRPRAGDFLAVSSKAVAMTEGAAVALAQVEPTEEARMWAERCGKSPELRQVMLDETARMHGSVVGWCPQAMLTELRPDGFPEGTLLVPGAGVDASNAPDGYVIGWPRDPVESVRRLRATIERSIAPVAVLLTDSCCRPRRLGVTAFALAVSGFDPLQSEVGRTDLFGRALRMTHEAIADQLATAANMVMGNANQSTPAAIIRDHGIPFSAFEGWVPGIEPERDLFRTMPR